jgi:hypothetical protein
VPAAPQLDGKACEYYNVSFLCSNMIRKEAAVKRDVSLTLSHVRCQLPRGNCFPLKMNSVKRERECASVRARACIARRFGAAESVCSISMVGKTTTCTLNCDKSNSCNYGGCSFFIKRFSFESTLASCFYLLQCVHKFYLRFTFGSKSNFLVGNSHLRVM